MYDEFARLAQSSMTPSENPFAVTPDDVTDLPVVPKAIYVGGAGTIVLRGIESEQDVTFVDVPAGVQLQVRPRRILATGTTATGIVALA